MKICIIDPHSKKNRFKLNEYSLNLGLGGSETWDIQFSTELSRLGNDTTLICYCDSHIDANGLKWISLNEIDDVLKSNKYDIIFIIRYFKGIIEKIDRYKTSNKVFLQAMQSTFEEDNATPIRWNSCEEFRNPLIKKIFYLSDHSKKRLLETGIPNEMLDYFSVGVDDRLFEHFDYQNKKIDHRILIASSNRGITNISPIIADLVKRKIPDFGIDIASPAYDDFATNRQNSNNIRFLGHLSKNDLYNEFYKHACWVYPSVCEESFCIVSTEAALSRNDLILPLIYGPATTFAPFIKTISMQNRFYSENAFFEMTNRIIDSIENYYEKERIEKREEIAEYIIKNFSIRNLVKKFLKTYANP